MLLRKVSENSHTVITILGLLQYGFDEISGKLYRNFLPLILSASPVSMHGVLQTGFHMNRLHK